MWKSPWSIGIGARILLFQAIIAAAVVMMAGVVYIAIRSADYYVNRSGCAACASSATTSTGTEEVEKADREAAA